MTPIIYGIKNCDTMKKARAWLDARGVAYDFHDYKSAGAERGCSKAGRRRPAGRRCSIAPARTFRALPEKEQQGVTEKKAIALMAAQPSMIKRPVLDVDGKLLVGFKPEQYEKAFPATLTVRLAPSPLFRSFPRKRESSPNLLPWVPAFAGTSGSGLLARQLQRIRSVVANWKRSKRCSSSSIRRLGERAPLPIHVHFCTSSLRRARSVLRSSAATISSPTSTGSAK